MADPVRRARAPARASRRRSRPRVGVIKFASCDGCQLTILDLEDELLALTDRFEFVEFAEATSRRSSGPFDVLFVEGSISHARSRPSRSSASARRRSSSSRSAPARRPAGSRPSEPAAEHEAFRARRLSRAGVRRLARDRARRSPSYVTVDAELRGCPIDAAPAASSCSPRSPPAAARSCPTRRSASSASAAGSSASSSRAASRASGPSPRPAAARSVPGMGRGCYGCFGPREGANVDSLAALVRRRAGTGGMPAPDVGRLFAGFTGASPAVPRHHRPARRAARRCRSARRPRARRSSPRGTAPLGRRRADGGPPMHASDLRFQVQNLTRVEGEGSLHLLVRDGAGRRGAAPDLRGAALLRGARRRPDAGRGPRHRLAHLRHLPRRVPDERRPRLRGPVRGRGRAGDPSAPPAPVLRRVDREPRAPHLPAPRPRLPRLPERRRAGQGPPPARRRRAAAQADRQPPPRAPRRPGHPSGQRPRRRLVAGAAARPSSQAMQPALHEALRLARATVDVALGPRRRRRSSGSRGSSRSTTRPSTR